MSKLSPYRKPGNLQKKQMSPPPTHYDNNPYNDRYKNTKQFSNDNKSRYNNEESSYQYRPTEKKKYDHISDFDLQALIEKNRCLAAENAELYQMLEERGQIVVALQKKLQEQIYREVTTLQAIEHEKNIFIGETQKKFKEYERKIEQLINEIYQLNEEKYQENMIKAREIDFIKDSFTKEQIIKLHEFANDQMTARQETEFERNKVKNLLDLKNHEISQINMEFKNSVDKLKNQIITLNNEIVHINHLRKIELSEQKIVYENIIDNIARENNKEKEIITIENNLAIKKLEQQIAYKAIESSNINELKKIGEIEQNVRETQLLQKKSKLQHEVQELEQFYRKQSFDYAKQQKQLSKTALQALESGNEALIGNLKAEIQKMVNLNATKSDQINNLFNEISVQRLQNSESNKNYENIIQQLKQKMRQIEKDHMIEEEQLKVKWAELSQANLATMKQYYEHEIDVLQHQFIQKSKLSDSNRQKLHQQLQQKNQMRKRFDLQVLKLNTRISELQLQVNELILIKKEETTHLSTNMQLTSTKLMREAKDKQKLNSNNEQERKKLQQLILAKDKEIQQLNQKIRFMRQNYTKQIAQKNAQIEIIKKHKEDVETQLRKQRLFYDNQIKKKDIILKDCRQNFDNQTQRLKNGFREQYESLSNDLSSKINQLEVELNRYKAIEKNLRNQNESLRKQLTMEIEETKNDLASQKERVNQSKKISEDRLTKQNREEQQRLNKQIEELRKQLAYKEQDLRNKAEDYHLLEQKMTLVIESQDKLRNIEHRIINLGQENNLVKNFAEIIKSKSSR